MNNTLLIEGAENIAAYQLLALKGALKLESLGLRHSSGKSALSRVRAMGIKARTASEALPLYVAMLRERGILA